LLDRAGFGADTVDMCDALAIVSHPHVWPSLSLAILVMIVCKRSYIQLPHQVVRVHDHFLVHFYSPYIGTHAASADGCFLRTDAPIFYTENPHY